jgi:hypothetical protein
MRPPGESRDWHIFGKHLTSREAKRRRVAMVRTDTLRLYERRFGAEELPIEHYELELAPKTPESLVTWDVSGHAQCEKDRFSSVYRSRRVMRGGY